MKWIGLGMGFIGVGIGCFATEGAVIGFIMLVIVAFIMACAR